MEKKSIEMLLAERKDIQKSWLEEDRHRIEFMCKMNWSEKRMASYENSCRENDKRDSGVLGAITWAVLFALSLLSLCALRKEPNLLLLGILSFLMSIWLNPYITDLRRVYYERVLKFPVFLPKSRRPMEMARQAVESATWKIDLAQIDIRRYVSLWWIDKAKRDAIRAKEEEKQALEFLRHIERQSAEWISFLENKYARKNEKAVKRAAEMKAELAKQNADWHEKWDAMRDDMLRNHEEWEAERMMKAVGLTPDSQSSQQSINHIDDSLIDNLHDEYPVDDRQIPVSENPEPASNLVLDEEVEIMRETLAVEPNLAIEKAVSKNNLLASISIDSSIGGSQLQGTLRAASGNASDPLIASSLTLKPGPKDEYSIPSAQNLIDTKKPGSGIAELQIEQRPNELLSEFLASASPRKRPARTPKNKSNSSLHNPSPAVEGQRKLRTNYAVERNPKLRESAIQIHGRNCCVCGFNFDEVFGKELAQGYIEVHHLNNIASGERTTDPATDLAPLCGNCHAMADRLTLNLVSPPRSIAQLRELLFPASHNRAIGQLPAHTTSEE